MESEEPYAEKVLCGAGSCVKKNAVSKYRGEIDRYEKACGCFAGSGFCSVWLL